MDKIVHICSGPQRNFQCYVHQLDRRPMEDIPKDFKKRRTKRNTVLEIQQELHPTRRSGRRTGQPVRYQEDSDGEEDLE